MVKTFIAAQKPKDFGPLLVLGEFGGEGYAVLAR